MVNINELPRFLYLLSLAVRIPVYRLDFLGRSKPRGKPGKPGAYQISEYYYAAQMRYIVYWCSQETQAGWKHIVQNQGQSHKLFSDQMEESNP